MTNAPGTRKTHVVRIFGTNRAGERLDDIWVDVERIDETTSEGAGDTEGEASSDANASKIGLGRNHQKTVRKFRWMDDPRADDYNPEGNPTRTTEKIKVCDPESENVDDPEEYVEIDVIKKLKAVASDNNHQRFIEKQLNDEVNNSREIEVRKIVHYDTNIDDAAQAAADADPSLRMYVVSGEEYTKDLDSKDEDQYVEHEIITKIHSRGNSPIRSGDDAQKRVMKLKNQYLIDESETPDGSVIGATGINPPYRLDPYQNIINLKLSSPQDLMIGLDNPDGSLVTSNGEVYDGDEFGDASTAASGLGKTVVTTGQTFVAFGKPRDGDKCFISVDQVGSVQRGVLVEGELVWSTVATLPIVGDDGDTVLSISFAGDAFFIAYRKHQLDKGLLAVSFNGQSFVSGINPWTGVEVASVGTMYEGSQQPDVQPGNVAYDPDSETYVTTGSYTRSYSNEIDLGGGPTTVSVFDENFMSSRSSDGLSWTPHFDTSEAGLFYDGAGSPGGMDVTTNSTIAFGNGIFVSTGQVKHSVLGPGEFYTLARGTAAAITSVDGASWSVHELPEQEFDLHNTSVTSAVKFVRKKQPDGEDGYFVIATVAANDEGAATNSQNLFRSLDGVSWSSVHDTGDSHGWQMSIINKNRGDIVFV